MKLLFICTHNRCRSIVAEAVTNHIGGHRIQAFSAGSSPQRQVHPLSLHYLSKSGVDVRSLKSQSWDEFSSLKPDAIITLCDNAASEVCPVWFDSSVQVHWGLVDPSSERFDDQERSARFQTTINIMKRRINALLQNDSLTLRGTELELKLASIAQHEN